MRIFAAFAENGFKKFLALIFLKRLISGIDVPDNSGMLFVSYRIQLASAGCHIKHKEFLL